MILAVSLCASLLCAQSGNAKFIDSPSWILSGQGGGETGSEKGEKESGMGEKRVEARNEEASFPWVAASGQGVSVRTGNGASSGKASERPSNEGFLHFGIYVVPTFNWLGAVAEPYERTGLSCSVAPTLMFDMRLFRRFYLGVGASFNTLGGKMEYPELTFPTAQDPSKTYSVTHTRIYDFSYVEIPVRIKLQTPDFSGSKGSMFFSAGVNAGFGVLYKYRDRYENIVVATGDMGDRSGTFQLKGQMKEDTKLMNFSLVGQMGYNHQISKRLNLILGVEYHYGAIQPMKKESGNQVGNWPEFHNHQVGIVLGIMF